MDQISVERIKLLHPKIRDEVMKLVGNANAALTTHSQVRIVQGLRTFSEQDALYKKRPKITNAKAGQSYHNYGLAFDFCLIIDGKEVSWDINKDFDGDGVSDWQEVISIFLPFGYKWGKSFNDYPHLEKKFGYSWQQLLDKYNKKDFIEGTEYVAL